MEITKFVNSEDIKKKLYLGYLHSYLFYDYDLSQLFMLIHANKIAGLYIFCREIL